MGERVWGSPSACLPGVRRHGLVCRVRLVLGRSCGAAQLPSARAASWRHCLRAARAAGPGLSGTTLSQQGQDTGCPWLDRRTCLCYAAPGAAVPPQCLGDTEALGPAGPQLRVGFLEMGGMEDFGDLWHCCPGGAGGPLIWGRVSVILVPSSGFVLSLVPRPPSQCHDYIPGAMATIPWWPPAPLALPALAFMGGGETLGKKGQAKRTPCHRLMPSPWSSPSGRESFSLVPRWFGMEM